MESTQKVLEKINAKINELSKYVAEFMEETEEPEQIDLNNRIAPSIEEIDAMTDQKVTSTLNGLLSVVPGKRSIKLKAKAQRAALKLITGELEGDVLSEDVLQELKPHLKEIGSWFGADGQRMTVKKVRDAINAFFANAEIACPYQVGDVVCTEVDGDLYECTVIAIDEDGVLQVQFEDESTLEVPFDKVAPSETEEVDEEEAEEEEETEEVEEEESEEKEGEGEDEDEEEDKGAEDGDDEEDEEVTVPYPDETIANVKALLGAFDESEAADDMAPLVEGIEKLEAVLDQYDDSDASVLQDIVAIVTDEDIPFEDRYTVYCAGFLHDTPTVDEDGDEVSFADPGEATIVNGMAYCDGIPMCGVEKGRFKIQEEGDGLEVGDTVSAADDETTVVYAPISDKYFVVDEEGSLIAAEMAKATPAKKAAKKVIGKKKGKK